MGQGSHVFPETQKMCSQFSRHGKSRESLHCASLACEISQTVYKLGLISTNVGDYLIDYSHKVRFHRASK